jgi:hypothetical protein
MTLKNNIHEFIPSEIRSILEKEHKLWLEHYSDGLGIYRLALVKFDKKDLKMFIQELVNVLQKMNFKNELIADYFTSSHWRRSLVEDLEYNGLKDFLNISENLNNIKYYIYSM